MARKHGHENAPLQVDGAKNKQQVLHDHVSTGVLRGSCPTAEFRWTSKILPGVKRNTPQKLNMEPENLRLEEHFPLNYRIFGVQPSVFLVGLRSFTTSCRYSGGTLI